ncbi:uncharacterized protein PV09_02343 [Verruconis gallopava]|uniref:Uncharacterized protein n=1 Tax=Verruconis gallopava TaxID=253628 RepID=A0A0D1XV25_9PEZI|nr:uncharacterized protein PV09_02343 [Verruconis gallopava]KIW06631.1 hypothetical protein PV09_02343 [Verruconis gallopava]
MARTSADVHALLNPPSPALTNPDLILPFDGVLGVTISPPRKQPPSPPDSDQTTGRWNNGAQQNFSMPLRSSPSRSATASTLAIIEEMGNTAKNPVYAQAGSAVGSSPTLKTSTTPQLKPSWEATDERRWSSGSGSVHSEDIENMHWPDFEGPSEVDEESVALEDDEEQLGDLPQIADGEDPGSDEQYLSAQVDGLDEDPLSRRADIILANAKKRLHAMEGKLRGARNSLLISAPSSPSSTYFAPSVDRERPRYPTATGIYGLHNKPRTAHVSSSITSNFGHSRMLSEASSIHEIQTARTLAIPKRSSSALGSFARGLSSLEKSASLRGVRSQQDMRERRLQSWIEESSLPNEPPRPISQQAELPHCRSPSMENFHRPGSAASSLRSQMDELKGRINNLKARAQEDRIKRLSSVGNRTPSPFVNASTDSEPAKGSSLRADSNLGFGTSYSSRFPVIPSKLSSSNSDEDSRSSRSRSTVVERAPVIYAESMYEDAEEALDNIKEEPEDSDEPSTPSTMVPPNEQKVLMGPQDPTAEELGYGPDDMDGDEFEDALTNRYNHATSPDAISLDGQSEYFDSVPVMAERHEDRADAFDYEHFFLHSAMGTYTRDRRDSVSSQDSVETTRPASPKRTSAAIHVEASSPPTKVTSGYGTLVESSPGLHRRSQSVESISTVATFQTATEGEDDSDGSDDPLDAVTQRILSPAITSPVPPSPKRMVDSAVHMPQRNTLSEQTAEMEQHELAAALVSSLFGIETKGSKAVPAQDVALVEGILSSLQDVVSKLQAQPDDYSRQEWRKRLDAARKALDDVKD